MRVAPLIRLRKLIDAVRALMKKLWPRTKNPSLSPNAPATRTRNQTDKGKPPTGEMPVGQTFNNDEATGTADAEGGLPTPVPSESERASSLGGPDRTISDLPKSEAEKPDPSPAQPATNQRSTPSKDVEQHGSSPKKARETKPKHPRNIGGQRNRPRISKEKPKPSHSSTYRPELICRQMSNTWQWEIALSADDKCRIEAVLLNDERLDLVNGESCLPSLTGQLTIIFEDGEEDKLPLFDDTPLVFKLRNNWRGEGRKTKGITKGHFIVIVPNEWERMGHVPVEPNSCVDSAFMAHYFFRDKTTSAEDIGGFRGHAVIPTSYVFELIGERIFDNSENGELFVSKVPKLKFSSGAAWVRIGEEKRNGWGINFKLGEKTLSEVLNNHSGRFFIRVYDSQIKLLDSGEFRYLLDLKEIRVNDKPYTENTILIPSLKGHLPTKVHFIGVDGATIQPILSAEVPHVTLQDNCLIVEPNPSSDAISCTLKSDNGNVDIELKLPRIWWRMEQNGSGSGEWYDTPITMTRRKFRELAQANATMRVKLPQQIKSVRIGFDDGLETAYHRKKDEESLSIRLDHFVDYSQIDQPLNKDASFSIECAGEILELIRIAADLTIISFTCKPAMFSQGKQATLNWRTKGSDSYTVAIDPDRRSVDLNGSLRIAPSETTTYTLRLIASGMDDLTKDVTVTIGSPLLQSEKPAARVKRTGARWGNGKGFSYSELRDAGLAETDAVSQTITIDKRRRSKHKINIETIRRLTDA